MATQPSTSGATCHGRAFSGAVMAAIEKLKAEGLPVQLYFATEVPSRSVRFIQVQADIVVDQLNYGRIGANARESMMLGRPV